MFFPILFLLSVWMISLPATLGGNVAPGLPLLVSGSQDRKYFFQNVPTQVLGFSPIEPT